MSQRFLLGSNVFIEWSIRETDIDGGPSVSIIGLLGSDEVEVIRADFFRERPHYHYDPNGQNIRYDIDRVIIGDWIVRWFFDQLHEDKLKNMLVHAGYPEFTARLDESIMIGALDIVEENIERAMGRDMN